MKWISIHSKKRLRILYVLFMCAAVAIVIRLFFLQVLDQKELTSRQKRTGTEKYRLLMNEGILLIEMGRVL